MLKNLDIYVLSSVSFVASGFLLASENGVVMMSFSYDEMFSFLMIMTSLVMYIMVLKMMEMNDFNYMIMSSLFMYMVFLALFSLNNILGFYILFELSVVPLMFLVSYWGYSLERIKAMFYMFMYTFMFSFPFLAVLLYKSNHALLNILLGYNTLNISNFLYILMMGMILVKMPLWGMHLWLVKAHVEASTEGSMVLASIVLKLSGAAMIKICSLTSLNMTNLFSSVFLTMAFMGAIFLSIYTMRQTDLKLIVAVSSIIHMSFMFVLFSFNTSLGIWSLILIMVSHGFVSPMMFLFLGILYEEMSTRSLSNIKGTLKGMTFFSLIWFFLCVFNMALPITMNFIGEMYFFFCSLPFSHLVALTCTLLIFINGLFNIFLYTITTSGQNNNINSLVLTSKHIYYFYSSIMMAALMMFMYN